jgi:hypothetical protein
MTAVDILLSLPSPQDYYAAAMALFGIIIFAKFASHTRASFPRELPAYLAHWACVGLAAIGAALCFFALGWASGEGGLLRWFVGGAALISGLILAVEVGGHGYKGWITKPAPAVPKMTLDEALDVADQVAQTTHVDTAVVERAAVLLAEEVKRLQTPK